MDHCKSNFHTVDGCFVYQVIGAPIEARCRPSDCDGSRTGQLYSPGDLVAIDRIVRSPDAASGGPFLRLADGIGWLFEQKEAEQTMRRVTVQSGLWCLYVGNFPEGQAMLRHPTDRSEMCVADSKKRVTTYDPLQKLYCDKRVQHPLTGVTFYRQQGTMGWFADKRQDEPNRDDSPMLIDERCIKMGLFAFQALTDVSILSLPRLGEASATGRRLKSGQVCVVDAVYQPSTLCLGSGPFLHLTDGSGWLLEKKNSVELLQSIPVKSGHWKVCVLNPPHGISLYRHPLCNCWEPPYQMEPPAGEIGKQATALDPLESSFPGASAATALNNIRYNDIHYLPGTSLDCDFKVTYGGVKFYLVRGTKGWIIDRSVAGKMLIQVENIQSSKSARTTGVREAGWTVEFVRGAAAVVRGLQELAHNPQEQVIAFDTMNGVRLHVYYAYRTVGISMVDPVHGKTQLFCRDCSDEEIGQIFIDPPLDAGSHQRYARRPQIELQGERPPECYEDERCIEEEEGYRNELLDIEREMERMKAREHQLLLKLKEYDDRRSDEAESRRYERRRRAVELEKSHVAIGAIVQEKCEEIAHRQEKERMQRETETQQRETEEKARLELTCLECYRTFPDMKKLAKHCKTNHALSCQCCRKTFRTVQALDEHCIRRGHY